MNAVSRPAILNSILILFFTVTITVAQEDYEVREVAFEGNKILSSDKLSEQILTYGTGSFSKLILRKDPFHFSREVLDTDIKRLKIYYQKQGFLSPQISGSIFDEDNEGKTVKVRIAIEEGQPTLVGSVDFEISSLDQSDKETVKQAIVNSRDHQLLKSGVRFRDRAAQADKEIILRALNNKGFPYAKIQSELTVTDSADSVDVTWKIDSGPRCQFGNVEINGTRYTSEDLVIENKTFEKGELYQRQEIEKSQQQIYSLGVYHIVSFNTQLSKNRDPEIPISVKVREAPRWSTKFGVGYGREDKFRVFNDARYLSFLGGARRLNLYTKHSGLEPYHINLKLTQPAFITPKTTMTISPFLRKQTEPAFTIRRYGANASVKHEFTRTISGTFGYEFEQVDLDLESIAEDPNMESELNRVYNKSSVTLGLIRDSSEPMFSPQTGCFCAFSTKFSGLDLGSDYHYAKLTADLRRYFSFATQVLALRLRIGSITSYDDHGYIPVEDRYYAGGAKSVRGWARSELGPKDIESRPIGGLSVLEGNIEIRYPIYGIVSGAVFYDYGNIWLQSATYHPDELRYAAGAGIRVKTPIGPVRLDVARPVFDDETKIQIHISVGQAF
ncbi:MAG: outer membrane protein assembly factor BamA [candidate division Zixibacteria bacterium]|nr:outer membrane protein assembly factor BamA [candidate division Zixibacteria bacterium]